MKIGKFKFEARLKPIHFVFSYYKRMFSSFTILAAHIFPSSRQAGIIVLGFYFVFGQCMPVKPSPLTDEERAMLDKEDL